MYLRPTPTSAARLQREVGERLPPNLENSCAMAEPNLTSSGGKVERPISSAFLGRERVMRKVSRPGASFVHRSNGMVLVPQLGAMWSRLRAGKRGALGIFGL